LQRRVAEEVLESNSIQLYFCDAPDSESVIKKLNLDLFGTITNWPRNFMGDSFGEAVAAETARLKRQIEK